MQVKAKRECYLTIPEQNPRYVYKDRVFDVITKIDKNYFVSLEPPGIERTSRDYGILSEENVEEINLEYRKTKALMSIICQLIIRHRLGKIVLDEPSFELFKLAKRIDDAENEEILLNTLLDLLKFDK